MDIEQVNRQFDEIARRLAADDQGLIRRAERIRRREVVHVALVFALLTAAVVLLAVGIAALSAVAWSAGLTAFVAAPIVDHVLQQPT